MGEALPNHAYVNLSLVGKDDGDPGNIVRCHTDLVKCCSFCQDRIYGTDHRGNWFAPGRNSRLPLPFEGGDIYEDHGSRITLTCHLVYITVIFQQFLSMMTMTGQ